MAQLHLKQWLAGAGGALLLSGSALAVTQGQQSQQPSQSQQQQQEALPNQAPQRDISMLEKQAKSFTDAWNQKDAKQISSLFTSNAALQVPSGATAVGRQEIEQAFTEELQQQHLQDAQMETEVKTVRRLTPNLFLVDSLHTITGPNVPQQQGQPLEIHAVIVAEKRGNLVRFREARAIPEAQLPEQQQPAIGGSGEQQPQPETTPPDDSATGGSAVEPEPLPDTGGSGTEPINPDAGGSGLESEHSPDMGGSGFETEDPSTQPDTGSQETPQDTSTEPAY